ncbi:precorrin-3B synthase [Actinomadura craniellae]|uniref:Precorrin-3B synthase n=1 Tax=Actinomadura craniellae TaxID=2231787 RepID=A0A365HCK9_9ACTN|nr:precorrin-3B synthase [Actinomadura craniellae]RAY16880.1 precorrin-3B synthase [Actinomadura craniellae]
MSLPSRYAPDSCPGALRIHAAADGGLARVRLPGGRLAAPGCAVLADAAADLGDGHLELTSRGNVQLRGLAPGAEGELGRRLRAAGLLPSDTHELARNITASVLTGRAGDGVLDVRPLVAGLDRGLCADPELAGLPGRFLFTIDDGRGDVVALRGDVGLYALDAASLAVTLGGADTGLRVAPEAAVPAVLAVARAFMRARTTEWRLTEWDDPGERLAPWLPGLGVGPRVEQSAARRALPGTPAKPPVGAVAQRDGRWALSALVPLGRLTPAQLSRLRGAEEIIITPWRSVVVPDLTDMPDSYGLVTRPGSGWEGLSSCAGRPGCARSLTDVRADCARTLDGAAEPARPELPVHWSGCERRCGSPPGRHVAVVATQDGYEVRLEERVRDRSRSLPATAAAIARTREEQVNE